MIDRHALRYFLAVIDQGNFSKAAAACHVSQPTLSVGIAKIEKTLGRPLFLRSNRRVELTEAGANLASHARRIEAEFMLAERSVRDSTQTTTIRLGMLVTTPTIWTETFLDRMRTGSSAGAGRVEIIEGRERDLLERLHRGRIDVALTILARHDDRLAADPLFSEGYGIAMATSHPLARKPVIEAAELVNDTMIVRRQCEALSETSRHFTARGVRPFFAARTMSEDRALAYVRSGLGITIMPDCFTGKGIVRPRLADFHQTRDIGLLYAPHSDVERLRSEPALRLLVDVIEATRAKAE